MRKALEGLVEGFASPDQKRDRFVGLGVSEIESHGRQQHAVDSGSLIKHLVPSVVPVAMVPEDRMAEVVQVSADLVPTTRLRSDFQEGKTGRGEPRSRPGNFEALKATKMGRRRLFRMGTRESFLEMFGVEQWSIDPAFLWHRTAYESLVVFLDLLGHEHLSELGGDLRGLGQENQSCGGTIQSMDRVEELLQLVAERLQEDRFAV